MSVQRKIIVAPLNWGLGHATRCVPIINALIKSDFSPVIASDGSSLEFLKKEFKDLEFIELPPYHISYGKNLKWSLLMKVPHILKAVKQEQQILNNYLSENKDVAGIISDNRFGMYSSLVPSVYITHQIRVLAGPLTPFTSYFHQRIIKRFDECWIPDEKGSQFSGKLSESSLPLNQKFIGILSRFKRKELEKEIDILIVLSGPEPNRTYLENSFKEKFYNTELKVLLVKGKIEPEEKETCHGKLRILNFALTERLETLLNSAKYVVCRSGYSSVMDLLTLGKRACLIPTKDQNEQEYLAKYLQQNRLFDIIKEKEIQSFDFTVDSQLSESDCKAQGLDPALFSLFKSK